MELLMIVLDSEEYFEKLIFILTESEITDATIVDSEGIGHFLAYEVPIFAGIRQFVGERKTANKTIFAILKNKEVFSEIVKLLKREEIDFSKPGIGMIARLPIAEIIKPDKER